MTDPDYNLNPQQRRGIPRVFGLRLHPHHCHRHRCGRLLRRRAKLRYHDPYPDHVKERTEAFEDGYTKGYVDAMDDFMRELANLSEAEDQKLVVDITDGKVKINKLNPK